MRCTRLLVEIHNMPPYLGNTCTSQEYFQKPIQKDNLTFRICIRDLLANIWVKFHPLNNSPVLQGWSETWRSLTSLSGLVLLQSVKKIVIFYVFFVCFLNFACWHVQATLLQSVKKLLYFMLIMVMIWITALLIKSFKRPHVLLSKSNVKLKMEFLQCEFEVENNIKMAIYYLIKFIRSFLQAVAKYFFRENIEHFYAVKWSGNAYSK